MRQRLLEYLSLSLFVIPVTVICAGGIWPAAVRAESDGVSEVTIAEYGEYLLYAPLYIAAENGAFAAEGLHVKIVPAGGDEKVFAALLSGSAQFGISDPTFTAISGERGRPGRVIAAILQDVPAWGVTKKNISAIGSASALRGLSVATYPAPSTSYSLQKRMFSIGGIAPPSIVQIAYGSLLAALASGRVDVALENEPNVSLAETQGAHRIYALHDYFPDFAFTGLMVLPEYVNAHSDTAEKIVRALLRGAGILFSDREKAVAILGKRFPELPQPVISKALEQTAAIGAFSRDGVFKKSAWNNAVRLRRELGDLKNEARFEEYVDLRFVEERRAKQ